MDTKTCVEIVQSLSEKLKAYYVFPDIAEQICKHLQKYLDEGVYANITADVMQPTDWTRRQNRQGRSIPDSWVSPRQSGFILRPDSVSFPIRRCYANTNR
jgi:hypothetical protein